MKTMNCAELRDMLNAAADRIIRCEPYLSRVDSAVGDGDHGIGMKNGMTAVKKVLAQGGASDVGVLFSGISAAMRQAMGGASGMIFSALFAGATEETGTELTPEGMARAMRGGLEAIRELGHAAPGDKTMVDALFPAVEAMEAHTDSFEALFDAAENAAREGMEKTKEYRARFGRAKNLGERAVGHADPGAASTWLIFLAMRDFVRGEETPDPALPDEAAEKTGGSGARKMLINDPADVVREEAEGFLTAYGRDYAGVPGVNGLVRREIPEGKTALLLGGGSGHEPMFCFMLGENLADAAANGNVFTSPDPVTIVKTAEAAQRGGGVLFLYGNYAGDNMNFDLAAEQLAAEGIPTRTVRVRDDVASAPRERVSDRRGIAGDLLIVKIAGAACAALPLDEAWRVTQKAGENLWTVGVGLAGATIPGRREPIFTLPDDEMEYGLGIHGEPGVRREKLKRADEITEALLAPILEDSGLKAGDRVCTYVNGLGSTTLMELMILNRRLRQLLDEKGVVVHDMEVGSYVTTLEMAGASISLLRLDDELQKYYDMPCRSPYYNKF